MTTLTSPGSPSNWDSSVTHTYSAYAKRWCMKMEDRIWKPVSFKHSISQISDVLSFLAESMLSLEGQEFVVIAEDEFFEVREHAGNRFTTHHWKKRGMPK